MTNSVDPSVPPPSKRTRVSNFGEITTEELNKLWEEGSIKKMICKSLVKLNVLPKDVASIVADFAETERETCDKCCKSRFILNTDDSWLFFPLSESDVGIQFDLQEPLENSAEICYFGTDEERFLFCGYCGANCVCHDCEQELPSFYHPDFKCKKCGIQKCEHHIKEHESKCGMSDEETCYYY